MQLGKPWAQVGGNRDDVGKGEGKQVHERLVENIVERIPSASNQQCVTLFNNTEKSAHRL